VGGAAEFRNPAAKPDATNNTPGLYYVRDRYMAECAGPHNKPLAVCTTTGPPRQPRKRCSGVGW
jgi:hypothetical protein